MAEKNKIRIRIKDIVHDVRAGMVEYDLMNKYGLSSRGLQSAFRKLVAMKAIGYEEICGRSPGHEDTCEVIDSRMLERNYVVFELPVVDVEDADNSGWIRDLTEKGLKVSGLKTTQGAVMKLLIVPDGLDDFRPISLDARCQWVSGEGGAGRPLAGFRITGISPAGRDQLNSLIDFMTVAL
ncbi:MAG: hypothetical protein V1792_12295 [Pseudomonadota bacterium]